MTRELCGNDGKWLVSLLFISALLYGQSSVLICIPGKQNTFRIQEGFETAFGVGKAMAFGRIKDLEAAIASTPEAGIIAPEAFVRSLRDYSFVLTGKTGNARGEKFLLVTSRKDLVKDELSDKKIGMLDFVGKDRLNTFVKEQFGISVFKLQRVNKEDDLLTMLGLEAVDAVIVSESQYKNLLENTKLPLKIIATSAKNFSLAVLAIPGKREAAGLKKIILELPPEILKEIGITGWEER